MQDAGDRGEQEKLINGYTLSAIRWIIFEDHMYNMMIIVGNTILCSWIFMRVDLCSHQKRKNVYTWGDGHVNSMAGILLYVYSIQIHIVYFKYITVLSLIPQQNWRHGLVFYYLNISQKHVKKIISL